MRRRAPRLTRIRAWPPLAVLILAQICYPLAHGRARAPLVIGTVILGFSISVSHALVTRGGRVAGALVAVTAAGGLAVETLGVHTGFPFGGYGYSGALGPRLLGVPLIIPLAWTWMAWPAWLVAATLTHNRPVRVLLAGLGLAAWDLFLDPQMVAEGYWHWHDPEPGLPGVPGIPLTDYLGWLAVAVLMMALFAAAAGSRVRVADRRRDAPMLALYLWTYLSSVLAHAAFLHLPGSAGWGALGMGLVAVPLVVALW
jgi:putative membrane protein